MIDADMGKTSKIERVQLPAPPSPKPAQIRAAREKAGLTQRDAAAGIYKSWRTWQDWEAGTAAMDPALWELWLIKTAHLRGERPR